MSYEQVKSLRDVEFKRLTEVKRHPFAAMLAELEAAAATKPKPGRPGKLSLADQLLMTLWYWRAYPTLFHLGTVMGVSEGTASRRVRWVEDVLIGAGRFALPQRSTRFETASPRPVVIVDATETPVERPKKKQRRFYSGKRQRHTLKSEVLIDLPTGRILATANAPGRVHDRRLRRERGSRLPADVPAVVDWGYQGLQQEHRLTVLPCKATKKRPLDAIQRAINRAQA